MSYSLSATITLPSPAHMTLVDEENGAGMVYSFKATEEAGFHITHATDAFLAVHQLTREQVLADVHSFFDSLHPADIEGYLASLLTAVCMCLPWQYEYRVVRGDGTAVRLLASAVPVSDNRGLIHWHGFLSNISECKEAGWKTTSHSTSLRMLPATDSLHLYASHSKLSNTVDAHHTVHIAPLAHEILNGTRRGEFVLYFQPQLNMHDDALIGAEALVRWFHPTRGRLLPSQFVPEAEATGCILQLGHWALAAACRQLTTWSANPLMRKIGLSVNISAYQIHQREFVDQVLQLLETTGTPPGKLTLEMTESMLIGDLADVRSKMTRLKAHGLRFSLDDFGVGYSSLSYLKFLPFDEVKIDRIFVRDIMVHPHDAAIVTAVIALAKSLGLVVVAEGVETEAQRCFLAERGCHSYQGFLVSAAQPVLPFERFVHGFGSML